MTLQQVHEALFAARTGGDLAGKVEAALVKKAAIRLAAIANAEDQRERVVCARLIDARTLEDIPRPWVTAVVVVLNDNGQLPTPTDAQVTTATDTAWPYIIASRV